MESLLLYSRHQCTSMTARRLLPIRWHNRQRNNTKVSTPKNPASQQTQCTQTAHFGHESTTEVFVTEILLTSPRKVFIFTIYKSICRIKVPKKTFNLILEKTSLESMHIPARTCLYIVRFETYVSSRTAPPTVQVLSLLRLCCLFSKYIGQLTPKTDYFVDKLNNFFWV